MIRLTVDIESTQIDNFPRSSVPMIHLQYISCLLCYSRHSDTRHWFHCTVRLRRSRCFRLDRQIQHYELDRFQGCSRDPWQNMTHLDSSGVLQILGAASFLNKSSDLCTSSLRTKIFVQASMNHGSFAKICSQSGFSIAKLLNAKIHQSCLWLHAFEFVRS